MFWSRAREKYKNVTRDDEEVKKYFDIMDKFQEEGYRGITGYIYDMGHKFISNFTMKGKTIEIGFGKGRQALFLKGNFDEYYPTEINEKYINDKLWNKFKNAQIADARNLPYANNFFDNVVSIYNLEHIQDIDKVVNEIKRVLKPNGKFLTALPCEDGLAWNLGRELTTRRLFMKKYKINYDKIIAFEHVHNLKCLKGFLEKKFQKEKERFFPFLIPSINVNLIYCAVFINKKQH